MRKFTFSIFLLGVILFFGSFKPEGDQEHYKNSGYFFAILDGKMFEMRDDDKYRAELINKSASLNNKTAELNRVATSLIFYGNQFMDDKGKPMDENIDIEYSFANASTGEASDLKIELNYDKHAYYHIPEKTRFHVSKIEWSNDLRNYLVSADFDCKMRRWITSPLANA